VLLASRQSAAKSLKVATAKEQRENNNGERQSYQPSEDAVFDLPTA
jgi:hypothetical protein